MAGQQTCSQRPIICLDLVRSYTGPFQTIFNILDYYDNILACCLHKTSFEWQIFDIHKSPIEYQLHPRVTRGQHLYVEKKKIWQRTGCLKSKGYLLLPPINNAKLDRNCLISKSALMNMQYLIYCSFFKVG